MTAESAEAYKPDRRPFEVLLEKAEADPDDVIHIERNRNGPICRGRSG